jgi:hypothetical protein
MQNETTALPQDVVLPFENHAHTITPFFKHLSVLNVAQSEMLGKPVFDLKEVVELRLAGDRNYSPVMPADSMYRKVGDRVITYAERFSDQYRQFLMGDNQTAGGTALEALADYGITPAQLSICRALKIYSIEALEAVDGHQVKALGMNANDLKRMARRYVEDHAKRAINDTFDKMVEMQAEIDRLRAFIPTQEASPEEIDVAIQAADAEFAVMTDDQIKDWIADRTGQGRPRGNPSRETLLSMAQELVPDDGCPSMRCSRQRSGSSAGSRLRSFPPPPPSRWRLSIS